MSEITRTEKFLKACIDGEPCALKPLTRVEKLLAELNDKLAGGPSEVVILPETELTYIEEQGTYAGNAQSLPEAGKTYIVTYNGTAYDCLCAAQEIDPGVFGLILGNSDALDIGVSGGNPNAPFAVLCAQDSEDIPVMVVPLDGATSVTLSIVEKAETASAGGGSFIVKATIGEISPEIMAADCTVDKTYEETLEAIKAGKYVACHAFVDGTMAVFPVVGYGEENICFSVYLGTVMQILMHSHGGNRFIIQSGE